MLFLNDLFFIVIIDNKLFVRKFAATLNSLGFNLRISTIPNFSVLGNNGMK